MWRINIFARAVPCLPLLVNLNSDLTDLLPALFTVARVFSLPIFVMNWRTESARSRLVRSKLRVMVDQWSRKVFAQGNCWCWQHGPEGYCDGRCWREKLSSVQTACSEPRWKTECQLGTVVLGASLLGTRCLSGSACGLAVLRSLSSSWA